MVGLGGLRCLPVRASTGGWSPTASGDRPVRQAKVDVQGARPQLTRPLPQADALRLESPALGTVRGPMPDPDREPRIDREDIDDIIGIASQQADLEAERITIQEVLDIGQELDLAPRHVDAALRELDRQREAQATAAAIWRLRLVRSAWGAAAALALVLLAAVTGQRTLAGRLAEVERCAAQVQNVIERQVAVRARLGGSEASVQRDAELAGAENRVHLERRRHDEAAADYNAMAQGIPGRWWAVLFGMPSHVATWRPDRGVK